MAAAAQPGHGRLEPLAAPDQQPPPPPFPQSTRPPLRCHTDSLSFAPNVLPRHPALGAFEEFAC